MWFAQNASETCNPHQGESRVCVIELESVTILSESVRILFQIIMTRRRVSDNLRWQIIGMRNAGLSYREIESIDIIQLLHD